MEIQDDDPPMDTADSSLVVTDVLCCAICRTDAKMWEQGRRDLVLPRVLGHEMVVRDETGGRFMVWPGKSCGTCAFCRSSRENLCEHMQITGFHTDGGFAEKALLPRTSLIPVPGSLSSPIACFAEPVGCVINALEKLPSPPGGRILIYGGGAMGLISGLYARHLGLIPLIIEKNETKIRKIEPFLRAADIPCVENTHESEFDGVINACADYTAFSQGISKIGKGGHLIFFSGISRNEQIDSSLLNLIHYKEAVVAGSYGLTRAHMHKAVPFMKTRAAMLELLIEEILDPENAPALMAKVLSGNYLKYILDFRKRSQAAF